MRTYAQNKAIEKKNKERILAICPDATEESGIYVFSREENGIRYGYVGQAKHLLSRLADHLKASCGLYSKDTQHIDNSITKHGLWSEANPTGYKVRCIYCKESDLNNAERTIIKMYANSGFQLRNKTIGGQDAGKSGMGESKSPKGYRDGLQQGYNNARKEVKHLFTLHLNAVIKSDKPNKTQEKALQKFKDFMEGAEQ